MDGICINSPEKDDMKLNNKQAIDWYTLFYNYYFITFYFVLSNMHFIMIVID